MKNLAKLILNFSLHFILLFLAVILLEYLGTWIKMARIIPLGTESGVAASDLAWKALPAVIYFSILSALSYATRRKIPLPVSITCVIILGWAFTAGSSLGIKRAESLNFAVRPFSAMESNPGLLLTRSDNAIILLKTSRETGGPRVVSIPGRPLIYQEAPLGPNNSILSLPALPFGEENPWFIKSVNLDFALSAREMENRLENSFNSFAIYTFFLILLLSSLSSFLNLSKWPLANLFMGALIFRLILSLETFLNTREVNSLLDSFLSGQGSPLRISPTLITPMIFAVLGILILIYTLLTRLARLRRDDED